jgi:hypothetical protein
MNSSTVSAALRVRPVVPLQTHPALATSFFYSSKDPYAVRVVFHVSLGEAVEWVFARDLLAAGFEGLEGHGDVRVWPSAISQDGTWGDVLNIELTSPFGRAQFEAPAGEVADFLVRTYQLVPSGQESQRVDVAAELDNLLGQAP